MELLHKKFFKTTDDGAIITMFAHYCADNGGRLYNLTSRGDFVDLIDKYGIETAVNAYNARYIYGDYFACLPGAKAPAGIIVSSEIDNRWDDIYKWAVRRRNEPADYFWGVCLSDVFVDDYFVRVVSDEDIKHIKFVLKLDSIYCVSFVEENDEFEFYYIDCNDDYAGSNMSCLKEKATGKIFFPDSTTYPISLAEAPMYAWVTSKVNIEEKTIESRDITLMNDDGKMEKYNHVTRDRLEFLNHNGALVNEDGEEIFDGITFVWQKNHTLCVKSYKDIAAGRKDISYIAIYKEVTDITPIKFYRQQNLNIEF